MVSSIIILSLGLFRSIGLSPADYKQDVYRIIYIHVPSAIMGESIFIFMAMCSFINIIWRAKISGMLLKAAAPIGMSFVLFVLTTGSIRGNSPGELQGLGCASNFYTHPILHICRFTGLHSTIEDK